MSHKQILAQLLPLELSGDNDTDLAVEGTILDRAMDSADSLLGEMFPYSSSRLLMAWERVTGIIPLVDEPVQRRRDKVIRQLRTLGDIKKPYFEALLASLGYSMTIQEYIPSMSGWTGAGDELIPDGIPEILFMWNCHIHNKSVYRFRSGMSAAGERLTWWVPDTAIEDLLTELRPAHVALIFSYS